MHTHRVYRALTRLYPRDFREHYRDDLVQHHADMIGERGTAAAWTRTALDLLVTVPRYQLETIMNNRHSSTNLNVIIGLIATAGAASFVVGFYPGVALIAIALVVAITQRTALARAIDAPHSDHRRRNRLITAAVLAAVFGAMVADALRTADEGWGNKAILYNIIGFPALIGAVAFLIAGLLTPTGPAGHPTHPTTAP